MYELCKLIPWRPLFTRTICKLEQGNSEWRPWVLNEAEALPVIKAAYDAGVNTWDTANMYSNGYSERVLGAALRKYEIPRASVVIMTKAFFPVYDDQPGAMNWDRDVCSDPKLVNRAGLNRKALIEAVDGSLRRLQTDYVDVLQIHRLDRTTPFEEIMKTLHDLVMAGKVRYIGASSMWAFELAQLQAIAEDKVNMHS